MVESHERPPKKVRISNTETASASKSKSSARLVTALQILLLELSNQIGLGMPNDEMLEQFQRLTTILQRYEIDNSCNNIGEGEEENNEDHDDESYDNQGKDDNADDNESIWKRIHGILLLQMGFFRTSSCTESIQTLMLSIFESLCALYQKTTLLRTEDSDILKEAFSLMLQVMNDLPHFWNNGTSSLDNPFWYVLEMLLDKVQPFLNDTTMEQFLLLLIKTKDKDSNTGLHPQAKTILRRFQKQQQQQDQNLWSADIVSKIDIANNAAVSDITRRNSNVPLLKFESTCQDHQIFYWMCLLHCHHDKLSSSNQVILSLQDIIMTNLAETKQYNNNLMLLIRAVDCLRLYAQNPMLVQRNETVIVQLFVDSIIMLLQSYSTRVVMPSKIKVVCHILLSGLRSVIEQEKNVEVIMTELITLKNIEQFLETVSHFCRLENVIQQSIADASFIVTFILNEMVQREEKQEQDSQHDYLLSLKRQQDFQLYVSVLFPLLSCEDDMANQYAVQTFYKLTTKEIHCHQILFNFPELLTPVASVIIASEIMTNNNDTRYLALMGLKNLLGKQQHGNLSIMARFPKVLEALVQVSAQTATIPPPTTTTAMSLTQHDNCRELAIYIIMKLCINPCNRRILAKQIGLIASLIRYVRDIPPPPPPPPPLDEGHHDNHDNYLGHDVLLGESSDKDNYFNVGDDNKAMLDRENVKQQILLIAKAL